PPRAARRGQPLGDRPGQPARRAAGDLLLPPGGDRPGPASRCGRAAQVAAAPLREPRSDGAQAAPARARVRLGPDGPARAPRGGEARHRSGARQGRGNLAVNAPFALAAERVSAVDLRQPDEVARVEAFVAEAGGSVFHRPAWLRAIERGTGQRARGLVAEKGGAITGWLPLTEVHSPVFGRVLASSGFAVEGGALAARESTAVSLCRAAAEYALRLSCPTVELRGGVAPGDWAVRTDSHCGF